VTTHTVLGPGTVTIGVTPMDFSAECKGAKILHNYEDVGEATTYLDGHTHGQAQSRTDGFGASLDNDLSAAGLYAYLYTNDLTEQPLTYTPNTAAGASWTGTVKLTLPDEIGADEFGTPIASEVEWASPGQFEFVPASTTP